MADENVIGLAMQLDVANLKAGLKEVGQMVKESERQFKNASAGLGQWSQSSDGLSAKLKQLDSTLDAQTKAVAGYKVEIARVSEQEGDHTEQLKKLKAGLENAQAAVKKTQSDISHYSESLVEVQRAEKEANSELGKLTKTIGEQKKQLNNLTGDYKSAVLQYGKNSSEAKALAKKIKELSGEIEDNESQVEDAEKAYEGLSKKMTEVGAKAVEKANKGFAKLGMGIGGLVAGFLATAEGTRELRTNMGRVNTAFEEAGFSAEQAESTYKKFYGILGDDGQTTEAVNHLAKLASGEEDLAKWANIATGVMGTFGDSLPIESLTEAANETAKTGEVAGSLADALNWAGISQDKFQDSLDKCNTEQERNQLITKTLNGLYGEAGKTYQKNNKDIIAQNQAQADLNKTMAELGKQAEPIMTQVKLMGAQIAKSLLPVVEKLIPKIKENLPQIAVALGSVLSVVLAMNAAMYINKAVTTAVTTAQFLQATGAKAAAAGQWLLNAAMSANPIGIVVLAIAGLVAGLMLLYKKSDWFREKWDAIWAGIKAAAQTAIDGIVKVFSGAWDKIKDAWNGAGKFFSGVWEGIKKAFANVKDWIVKKFTDAWNGIKGAFGKTKDFFVDIAKSVTGAFKALPETLAKLFSGAWDKIKGAFKSVGKFFAGIFLAVTAPFMVVGEALGELFKDAWKKIKDAFANVGKFFSDLADTIKDSFGKAVDKVADIGKNIVKGLWNGINDMSGWIKQKISGFSESVLNGIKDFFGIHSPSTVMAEVGGYMAEGMAEGLEGGAKNVAEAGKTSGAAYADGVADGAQENKNIFQKILGWLKDTLGAAGSGLINSIAKLLGIDMGAGIDAGIAEGIEGNSDEVDKALFDAVSGKTVAAPKVEAPAMDTKSAWDKWISDMNAALDKSEDRLKAWTDGAGRIVAKLGDAFGRVGNSVMDALGAMNNYFARQGEQRTAEIEKQLEALSAEKDAELAIATDSTAAQLADLDSMYDAMAISAEDYRARRTKIEKNLADKSKKINDEKAAKEKALLEEKDRIAKKQFESEKATSIAQTVINGAQAIVKGFAELGPIGGAINAGIQAGITAMQIATIASQKYVPKLAKGGIVDKATYAMIGENGKEAVMPLEKNTGWIEELAEKLNSIMRKDILGALPAGGLQPAYAYEGAGVTNNYTQIINAPKQPSRVELYRDTKNLLALKG